MDKHTWMLNVPITEIIALLGAIEDMEQISAENKQMRREIEGLRRVQNETLELVCDLRKEIRKRKEVK